jgi:hypothetical protein
MSDAVAVRRRIVIPANDWAVSQAARIVMQDVNVRHTIVHKNGSLVIEAWYEPDSIEEEHFETARAVVTTACFLIAHDKTAHIAPISVAQSVADRCFDRLFANQETF